MTKSVGVLLVAFVVVLLVVAIVFFGPNGPDGSDHVEIKTTPGTKVFAKLPGGEETFLNSVSTLEDGLITVDVPINAEVILRYNNNEKIFPYETYKEDGVTYYFPVSIQIEADPWAYVFIKLPRADDFIEPRPQDYISPPGPGNKYPNLTPIRGGLKLPISTAVKLVYQGKEKVFPYQTWKSMERISHNFSNP